MLIYDVMTTAPAPIYTWDDWPPYAQRCSRIHPSEDGGIVRIAHDGKQPISALFWVRNNDDRAALHLMAQEGFSFETSTNPIHFHITQLTAQANRYAARLDVEGFTFITQSRPRTFIQSRFPEWTVTQEGATVRAILDV